MSYAWLLALGLVLRLLALPLEGTEDMQVWKTWSYGTREGILRMYGIGGEPPVRGLVSWGDRYTTVDYPPGTLVALAALADIYHGYDPAFRDSPALTAALKLTLLLADVAACAVLWRVTLRLGGAGAARIAVLFFWLNPAVLLNGAVLG